MHKTLKIALLLAAVAIIISLVYTKLPVDTMTESGTTSPKAVGPSASIAVPAVTLSGRTLRVDIADTPEEREQGLSGRTALGSDEAMLFIFSEDGRHGFWMKDMHFSIDIIWIEKEGRIVDMIENVGPETYPEYSFLPNTPARYVLEVRAGFSKDYNVKVGDHVELRL